MTKFGQLAQETNTMIIPGDLSDVAVMVATLGRVFQTTGAHPPHLMPPPPPVGPPGFPPRPH